MSREHEHAQPHSHSRSDSSRTEHHRPATLRSRMHEGPFSKDQKRFNIFLIDSGWNASLSGAVRENITYLLRYHPQDSLYVLTQAQSIATLKHSPDAIGHDPIVMVYDLYAANHDKKGKYRGFRLNLGLIKSPEQAIARLRDFVRFVAVHRESLDLEREVKKELHREGIDGMIKILREASTEFL